MCPRCDRQNNPHLIKKGHDMTLDQMEKISKFYKIISLCGTRSDPIYHPQFLDILDVCKKNELYIDTNGSGKKMSWWEEAAKRGPRNKIWKISLDGLPEKSHIYRINQDGKQVFEVMKKLKDMGERLIWQHIIFKYNEDDIDQVKKLAKEYNITLELIKSSRWIKNDPYKPTNPEYYRDFSSMYG